MWYRACKQLIQVLIFDNSDQLMLLWQHLLHIQSSFWNAEMKASLPVQRRLMSHTMFKLLMVLQFAEMRLTVPAKNMQQRRLMPQSMDTLLLTPRTAPTLSGRLCSILAEASCLQQSHEHSTSLVMSSCQNCSQLEYLICHNAILTLIKCSVHYVIKLNADHSCLT